MTSTQAQSPWPYEYLPGEIVVPCGDDEQSNCVWHRLVVDNQSDNTLECIGSIDYDNVNREQQRKVERKMVIDPRRRNAVLADMTAPEVKAVAHGVRCAIRKPYDDSKLTPHCRPALIQRPGSIDYPPESRRAGEEGPVLLEFSLTNKEGPPTDIVVVGSSLYPRLDAAAVEYLSRHTGLTDCERGRFRMPLTFRLR